MKDFFGIGWGWVSFALNLVSGVTYMRDIYTRKIEKPVVSTLFLWWVIGAILFVASIKLGTKWDTTLPPILLGAISPGIILLLAVRYGDYNWNTFDSWCAGACLTTLFVWQATDSPLLGMLGGLIADIIAATPMAIKSWKNPKDEPIFPWALFTFASAVNILAVEEWIPKQWLFPVYMTIMGFIITSPLIFYRLKKFR